MRSAIIRDCTTMPRRCVNCSLSLVPPLPYREITKATEAMLSIVKSWIYPARVSVDDVLCRECFMILETESLNSLASECTSTHSITRTYGHVQVCFVCGTSVLRAKTHRVTLDSPEGNVIMACVPIQQVHRLEKVCLPCWSNVYISVRRHTQITQGDQNGQEIIHTKYAITPKENQVSVPSNGYRTARKHTQSDHNREETVLEEPVIEPEFVDVSMNFNRYTGLKRHGQNDQKMQEIVLEESVTEPEYVDVSMTTNAYTSIKKRGQGDQNRQNVIEEPVVTPEYRKASPIIKIHAQNDQKSQEIVLDETVIEPEFASMNCNSYRTIKVYVQSDQNSPEIVLDEPVIEPEFVDVSMTSNVYSTAIKRTQSNQNRYEIVNEAAETPANIEVSRTSSNQLNSASEISRTLMELPLPSPPSLLPISQLCHAPLNVERGPRITSRIYKRANVSSRHCVFSKCSNTELIAVPSGIKAMLLMDYKFYVPASGRICGNHIKNGSWNELVTNCDDFAGWQMDDMMSIMDKACRRQ